MPAFYHVPGHELADEHGFIQNCAGGCCPNRVDPEQFARAARRVCLELPAFRERLIREEQERNDPTLRDQRRLATARARAAESAQCRYQPGHSRASADGFIYTAGLPENAGWEPARNALNYDAERFGFTPPEYRAWLVEQYERTRPTVTTGECQNCGAEDQQLSNWHCAACRTCERCGAEHATFDAIVVASDHANGAESVGPCCARDCQDCEEAYTERSLDRGYCASCMEDRFTCAWCAELFLLDGSYEAGGDYYCLDCYRASGRESEESDDEADGDGIQDYSYKPRPVFQLGTKEKAKDNTLYFGLEVEAEAPRDSGYNRGKAVAEAGITGTPWYAKSDGSIAFGAEMVSHPGSFKFWSEHDFAPIEALRKAGWKAYNTDTCGLHIHVSRAALGPMTVYKLLRFFRRSQGYITLVSRRKAERLRQWAGHEGAADEDLIRKAKSPSDPDGNKYKALNTCPYKTVEFRLFRGTLNRESIRAMVGWTYALVQYLKNATWHEDKSAAFVAWLKGKEGKAMLGKKMHATVMAWHTACEARSGNPELVDTKEEVSVCA